MNRTLKCPDWVTDAQSITVYKSVVFEVLNQYTAILAAELKPTKAQLLLKLLQKMKQHVVMSIISVIINATVN